MPPRKPQREEGGTLPLQPSSPRSPLSSGWSPAQGPTFLPGSSSGCLPQCLLGPWLSAEGREVSPLWEGRGLGCAGACGGAEAANLTLSPRFCSHTPLHTHAHIHAHRWTNGHTSEGVCITLTKARTESQKSPPPQVSGSLPTTTVRLSTGTWVLCSRWTGPRDTCRAVSASLGGCPGPPHAGLRKGGGPCTA